MKYDFKELASEMLALNEDDKCVHAVLFYEQAIDLIKEFLKRDEVFIASIEIASHEIDGYDKEFMVSLLTNYDSGEVELWCEKMWHDDNEHHKAGYYGYDADVVYVDENANSKSIAGNNINVDSVIELVFDDDEEDDDVITLDLMDIATVIKDDDDNILGLFIDYEDLECLAEDD